MFQNNIIEEVWDRTRGKCMFCGKKLVWKNREKRGLKGAWKIGPISDPSTEGYVLSNCEIDCLNCYELTRVLTIKKSTSEGELKKIGELDKEKEFFDATRDFKKIEKK